MELSWLERAFSSLELVGVDGFVVEQILDERSQDLCGGPERLS